MICNRLLNLVHFVVVFHKTKSSNIHFLLTSFVSFALLPFVMCRELSTFIGSGSVMVTAALYGVMAIGKK